VKIPWLKEKGQTKSLPCGQNDSSSLLSKKKRKRFRKLFFLKNKNW